MSVFWHLTELNRRGWYISGAGEQGRSAEAGRQQDRVRAAGVRAGPRSELRGAPRGGARRTHPQGVHVQLGAQVDEHRHTARRRWIHTLHQGRLGDRTQEVIHSCFC